MAIRDIIEDLAVRFYKNKIIKGLFAPLFHVYLRYTSEAKEIDNLKKNFSIHGLEVLKSFDDIMSGSNIKYSLAFGSMLGAVREKGFIKHDLDIDVYVWIEDYSSSFVDLLKSNGFSLKHTFSVDNDKLGKEDTIEKNGVQIDIFYVYPALFGRKYPYCCDFVVFDDCRSRRQSIRKHGGLLPRRIEMPMSNEVVRVPFENTKLPILNNAHEYLSFRYGTDYMTPNPNWVNSTNKYIIPWVDKVAVYY